MQSGTFSLYGPTGAYQGRIVLQTDSPDKASVYDARGRLAGWLVGRTDGRHEVFGAKGQYQGTIRLEQPPHGPDRP